MDIAPLNLSNLASIPSSSSFSSSNNPSFNPPLSSNSITKRGRSSSILSMHEIKENYDDALDQSAMANLNADWVNYKGEYMARRACVSMRVEGGRSLVVIPFE